MSSITFISNGKSSILNSYYHPEIKLSPEQNYALALLQLLKNIDTDNNTFYYGNKVITIPIRIYEIKDIEPFLRKQNANIVITLYPNTLKSHVVCNKKINFLPENTTARLLSFKNRILEANINH